MKFQQYTVYHGIATQLLKSQISHLSAMMYYYPLSISNTQNKSPSWLDLPHPIIYHTSYVIPIFRNLYRVMKCECYCVFLVSEKNNVCLIIKVLLLRRIKLFNNNLNKKEKHMRKFDVRSNLTQELKEIDFYFNIFTMQV